MVDSFQFELFNDPANRVLAAESYEDFCRRLLDSGCSKCGLARGRTNIVIDRGNHDSKLMLIGEGPGQQEDLQGEAFVGRAGHLLDEIMSAIDLDTNRDMLIVNVVKCRPPNNRQPQIEEARACMPFLKKQIQLIRPRCILLLGAVAARFIFPERKNLSMAEESGRFFTSPEFPGMKVMILYHPAYLLRDPRRKKEMWEHIRTFQQWWREAEQEDADKSENK